MVKKAKRIRGSLDAAARQKYRDLRKALDTERDGILSEGRRRKRVRDTVTAELREAFGVLKEARHARGLSLTDMAALTGMSRSAISRLENDDSANPTIETLTRYADALGKKITITLKDKAS